MSLPAIILISKPQVDFKNYLFLCKSFLDRSVSAGMDKHNRPVKDAADFICLLDEFAREDSNPSLSLMDAGDLLKHLHYTFLGAMEYGTYVALLERTGLHFTVSEIVANGVLATISGTLLEYRTCIINLCTEREAPHPRHFATKLLEQFDKLGLGQVFSRYSRSKDHHGLALLTERK